MAEEKCIALTSFTASAPDELSFAKGDVITVVAKGKDSGFWEGRIGERRGLFPNCFVSSNMHPNRPPGLTDTALALFTYRPQRDGELGFEKHDLIGVSGPGASPGWFLGINVTALQKARAADPDAPSPEPRLFPSNYVTCNLVRAQYAFNGRQRCELSLQPGDVIIVHRRWNDGWWEGSRAAYLAPVKNGVQVPRPGGVESSTGGGGGGFVVGGLARGIFPSNYTASNVPTTDPPLFCRKCRSVLPPKAGGGACPECGKNEEIMRTMLNTLDDVAAGLLVPEKGEDGKPKVDLFAHIDVDPSKGRGSLLDRSDVAKDTTVRPRLAV